MGLCYSSQMAKNFWLMKTEPSVYSIDDLQRDKTTLWEGVRNYQARNFMTEMQAGDEVLIYHSSAEPPGVAGIATVVGKAKPDPSQFNKKSEYYDPKATPEKPIWFCPEVRFVSKFSTFVSLDSLRTTKGLEDLLVLKRGQRLSIQPVKESHFNKIAGLAK